MANFTIWKPDTNCVRKMTILIPDCPVFRWWLYMVVKRLKLRAKKIKSLKLKTWDNLGRTSNLLNHAPIFFISHNHTLKRVKTNGFPYLEKLLSLVQHMKLLECIVIVIWNISCIWCGKHCIVRFHCIYNSRQFYFWIRKRLQILQIRDTSMARSLSKISKQTLELDWNPTRLWRSSFLEILLGIIEELALRPWPRKVLLCDAQRPTRSAKKPKKNQNYTSSLRKYSPLP
jgi:hypothetical protein